MSLSSSCELFTVWAPDPDALTNRKAFITRVTSLNEIVLDTLVPQRRALAARRLEREVRRRVASDILSRDRSASFTAAELRNALATSGSKTTTFAPSFKRRR